MTAFTRTLYLGPEARQVAYELGYKLGSGLRATPMGLAALALPESDIEAFIALCEEREIKDFK
jgi:hypothetical protein